jgi:hypothetical protein
MMCNKPNQSDQEQCIGTHNSTGTSWASSSPPNISVSNVHDQKAKGAPGSYLAIARPGIDDETLRLFYQEEQSAGKFPIREIRYQDNEGSWTLQRRQIEGAAKDSSFSAASAGKTGQVRVYYVDSNNLLRVGVWSSQFTKWEESKCGLLGLESTTPIH